MPTATQEQAKSQTIPSKPPDQSVYVADKDIVKTYPLDMSNDEIDFDLHTTVRGKPPEDYFVNFLPLTGLQKAFESISLAIDKTPPVQIAKGVSSILKAEADYVDPAMKLIVSDPAYALGFSKETTPEAVANTYKPWLDIWRESLFGSKLTAISDEALRNAPPDVPVELAGAAALGGNMPSSIPWFAAEFMPDQLLQFGTKASQWIGAYSIEKFGPPLINVALSRLSAKTRASLLKELLVAEKNLATSGDFETLGIKVNSKTSSVVSAYRKAAAVTHPDLGGNANEFIKVNSAYENIMKSRAGWMDKLYDIFRAGVAKHKPPVMSLSSESGAALIPFSPGDLVRFGKDIGQVVNVAGQIATVNIAGKLWPISIDKLTAIPQKQTQIDADESAVNLKNLQVSDDAKLNLMQATDTLSKEIENQIGKPLTHAEVIDKAKEAEILTKGVSRETTLEFEASLLKTRQHLSALAQQNDLTPEFLETLKVMANLGTDIARNLESFKIEAMPEFATVKVKIIKDLLKLGVASQDILRAAQGVDFKDEQAVAKFYRKFVKPTIPELLDEFVYINILSSPTTHIVNIFSNVIQLAGLNPLTKLASGAVDFVASKMTGKQRTHYVSEVPTFYKGVLNSVPEAFKGALAALKGKKNLERPDVKHLPTLSKLVDWGTLKVGKYVPRALEASDVFFRTMIEAGEIQVLSKKLGHPPDPKEMEKIEKEARKRADYYVFRSKPDSSNESGQGDFLSAIDQLTNAVYRLRAVPGFKWFIRFVQTPMNIVKQGVEYSPAGMATFKGAKDKTEQAAKTIIGSLVFAGGSWLAANNLTTWAAPTSDKEKEEFYSAGLQPYSVRVGDKWVSYSKLGPLSYPLAMASALHYFSKESPNALSDSEMDKIVDGITGIFRFFADQSYMQGIGDLVGFARGEKSKAISSMPTQLIPLSSLQGWVNNIMDEIQRKPEKGLSIDSIVDNIQMKIVGMSKFVPPRIDSEEVPVKKQMRGGNAVSPMRVSKVHHGKLAEYKENVKVKQEVNKIKKDLA